MYETYAQTLQQEIDHIMETIKNITKSQNQTKTKSDYSKQILDKLTLKNIPDLLEIEDEVKNGYKLLDRLKINDLDRQIDYE